MSLLLNATKLTLSLLAQSYDNFPEELTRPASKKEKVYSQPKRTFKHQISKAAVTTATEQTTVLSQDQLKQCGNAYINNGIVRGVVDRSVFFIQGDRTKAIVEANDELLETSDDEEAKNLDDQIANDTLTIEADNVAGIPPQPARINDLKRKVVRLNKRVKLYNGIEKFLTSALVFGRGFLEIVRLPPEPEGEWKTYGEPIALKHLTTKNVEQVYFNRTTGIFEGIDYNTGDTNKPVKFIKATNLIPAFHDDNNIVENTQGSGLSAVWPILSVSQSDEVINDEDIPEITKNTGGVLTLIYGGTNNDDKLRELSTKLNGKTQVVHGLEGVQIQSVPLGRDPHELIDVRISNGKYICQCMNLPLFLMYEDTANFATANQTMQVYKAGVLKRYRAWLQGILEDYWYDTILADHLGIEVKDVVSAPIKVKAIFQDINFETRKEVIEADKLLVDMEVFNRTDVAKDIDRKDIVARLEQEEAEQDKQKEQAVNSAFQNLRAQNLQLQAQNQNQNQNQNNNIKNQQLLAQQQKQQQASAAASTKQNDQELHNERMKVFANINQIIKKLDSNDDG